MKPLMPPIDTPDQVFHDGDPSTGELGTICSAEWLNNVQGSLRNIQAECIAILKATGFTPDSANDGQLWAAIQAAIKSQVPAATVTTAGITQLSSSVTSDSETIAATLKAVKIAMDNANERLAKARNLADLQSIPLALNNLTLTNVKKAVEDTHLGLNELPIFRPGSEDDLDALPAGYMAVCKNKTPGGPLPGEVWYYLYVTGKIDNISTASSRKGGVIHLTGLYSPAETWTGVKSDYGNTTTVKYTWARDYNTLYKPTPEDVGLAATKKAIDDTQIGLSEQPVMRINSADDLSNLPAGARRFAINNTGVTVLPSADYCYIEVLAKRDTGNGSCIKVVEYSNPGNAWTGTRNNVPADAAFTWVRQYNENYRQPLQALPDSLIRGNNLSDLTDPAAGVRNLGLTDTVNRAAHVHPGDGDLRGSQWGNTWLSSWLNGQFNARATADWVTQNFITRMKRGEPVNPGKINEYGPAEAPVGCVVTSVRHDPTTAYGIYFTYRPLSVFINGTWRVIEG
ncbi:TPA: tail fiber protein [Salmonella enterica subsp. enterica serovar Birkenhead]